MSVPPYSCVFVPRVFVSELPCQSPPGPPVLLDYARINAVGEVLFVVPAFVFAECVQRTPCFCVSCKRSPEVEQET